MRLLKNIFIALCGILICLSNAQATGKISAESKVSATKIDLTIEEINWINNNKTVNVATKTGWMPIEYKLEGESSRGVSLDYLNEISLLTGLKFNIIDYSESLNLSNVQLISGVAGKTELENYTKITPPYLSIPYAIYVNKYKKNNYRSLTLEDLSSAKIAIFKNVFIGKKIKEEYPNIQLIYVDIADEAFEYLKNNQIDAYIGSELIIDYHIEFHRLAFVEKTSTTNYQSQVSMAVRSDLPLLNSIIDKSLKKIGTNNTKIIDYWKSPNRLLYKNIKISAAVLIFVLLVLSYRLLAIRKKSRLDAEENQRTIRKQANFDRQTGVPNRNYFEKEISETISNARKNQSIFAFLYIDLDDFKNVNDISGHSVGDKLLKEASSRLMSCIGQNDFLARIGGDEFAIILPEVDNTDVTDSVCQKILNSIRMPFNIDGHDYYITSSIGIAIYPNDTESSEELLSFADQAMYEAKKRGRDRYHRFSKNIQESMNKKISIGNDLRQAMHSDQFELVYQPIIRLDNLKAIKAEALIRWHHPEKGLINPDQFILIAEETGMIHELGRWILSQVIKDIKYMNKHLSQTLNIGINMSPLQFTQPQYIDNFIKELGENDISPEVICFEITEGLLLDPSEVVIQTIRRLKKLGVKFSIDDFGTGYSALAYLKKFDIDYVKIDKSFIRNLDTDHYNKILCESIISMAHKLNIKLIAEGVEYAVQENILREFNCDYLQGYLYGRPMALDVFVAKSQEISLAETAD